MNATAVCKQLLALSRISPCSGAVHSVFDHAVNLALEGRYGLIGLIAQIQARGVTILLIEHDMRLVMRACEKLVVLEYGGKIAEGTPDQIRRDPRVIEAYLGAGDDD